MKKLLLYLVMVLVAVLISCEIDDGSGGTDPTDPDVKEISVQTPGSGDSLSVAGSYLITWESNTDDKINIDYTLDNGSTWLNITSNLNDLGSYVWSPIPNTLSDACKIRVSTTDSANAVIGYSDGVFSIVPLATKSIKLNSPNGGERVIVGSNFNIIWTSKAIDNIVIELSTDNGTSWNSIVDAYPADSMRYNWSPIPNLSSVECLLRISDVAERALIDVSDAAFTITEAKEIIVTAPNGGESWTSNSAQEITWYSSLVETVNIDYTTDNGVSWINVASNIPSNGLYLWEPIPNMPSNNAKVRITNVDNGFPSDESDAVFSLAPEEFLRVVAPNGGEVFQSGSSQYIIWQSSIPGGPGSAIVDQPGTAGTSLMKKGKFNSNSKKLNKGKSGSFTEDEFNSGGNEVLTISSVKIEYSTNNGSNWTLLTDSTPNNGSYLWNNVPVTNSTQCIVRVSDAEDSQPFDLSDASFTIFTDLPQEIIVTVPNGGEAFVAGSSEIITWEATGVSDVKIEYTNNNGISWVSIVESTPSDGFYTWATVPSTVSTNCRIRISDAVDGSPSDISDGLFVIAPEPYITILSPEEDESYAAGASSVISWRSENVAFVKIEFTSNGGANWETISESEPSDGEYLWEPIPSVISKLCRIKISNAASGLPFQISGFFEISDNINVTEQSVKLLSPNGGEEYEAGTTQNITWEATAIDSFDLEFTTDNGNSWIEIESGIMGSGYEWKLPINVNSPLTKVRVSDSEDGEPFDNSDGNFTVKPAEFIVVLKPSSGDSYASGEPITIEWEATGIENVGIQYTTTNGLGSFEEPPFYTVTASTPNTGSIVTSFSIASDKYYVLVYDATDNAPQARSLGTFRVSEQIFGSIDVLKPVAGDTLYTGTTAEIKWRSQYVENVNIEFSRNFGATWETIVENTPSDGSFIWGPVPDVVSDLCAVRISDASRLEVTGISEAFVIAKQVQQIAGEPASIYLVSQTYEEIGVTESGSPETSQITFEVQDSSGLPIDFAHAVDVNFRFGARPGGGEFLAPSVAQTDEKGKVNVNLSSGTVAGAVQVIAEINFGGALITSRPVNIAIHGGLPNADHFAIASGQLNYPYYNVLNGIGTVTAVVGDQYSNPVKAGTAVYFSTEAGIVEGSNLTDLLGRTTVALISGAPIPDDPVYGPGFFWVTGETINESNTQITTDALVLYSGVPFVSISPTSFNIPSGGSVSFTYIIRDQNDNPLAPLNKYTVSASGGVALGGQTSVTMPDVQFGNKTFTFTASDADPTDPDPPVNVTITVTTEGPNGVASSSVSGTAD